MLLIGHISTTDGLNVDMLLIGVDFSNRLFERIINVLTADKYKPSILVIPSVFL
jgi:hypothetical protein